MNTFQKIMLPIVIIAIILGTILTWGSIMSVILVSSLLMFGPIYLFNKTMNNDEPSDFQDDDP